MREVQFVGVPAQELGGQCGVVRWSMWPMRRAAIVAFFMLSALAVPLLPAMGGQVLAGQGATVVTDVLNLRADANTKAGVLDQMVYGDRVDILYGPFNNGWYQVRFNGTDGYAFGSYLDLDGQGRGWSGGEKAVGGDTSSAVTSGPEHWIDVNRSSGDVSLMIGDEVQASYGASFGYDTSASGFYATAVGTYYVTSMNAALTYTPWANAYIEYWVGFDDSRSNGFHSWTMDANGDVIPGGDGPTGGCIATAPGVAAEIYNFASPGMRVEIHF
jgi:hypothetical protein